jgi:subfamily B ATP-binding cassette protein MsbA
MKGYFKQYFKLLRFLKPFKATFILAGIFLGINSLFEGATLGMIPTLIDRVFTNNKIIVPIQLPPFLMQFVDKLNALDRWVIFKAMLFVLPLIFLLKGITFCVSNYLMNMISQGVVRDVKDKLYSKFQELSLEFYAQKRTGELISRITNDVSYIANSLSYALTDLISETISLIIFAVVALSLALSTSWKMLIVFIIFPLIMIPVTRVGKRIKKFSLEIQKKMADLTSLLSETIQGAYIVKVFCREDYELQRFKEINRQYYRFTMKTIKRTMILPPLTEFIGSIGAVMIVAFAGPQVLANKLSFGIFALFMMCLLSMMRPIKKLSNVYAINQQAIPASNRIYDILDEEPRIKEGSAPQEKTELRETITFDNVWFQYNEKDDYVLKDISIKVKKGEVIALVGHSGAGKSTLVNLLPRLYDPQKGRILFDDSDIKNFSLMSLRSLIAVVSQDMVLFNATVKDNIAYGRRGATDVQIIEAAKKAFAYDFINQFPQKFDTVIGDRGLRLSGGEKQRIAIARAMLKDAPILILDEATSQLDSASESLIKEALYTLMEDKTTFTIAHRLSTVQKADKILVMEKGRLIEAGTHNELLNHSKVYKRLYELQFNV